MSKTKLTKPDFENDTLQRFLFENSHVRGEIIRLNATYQVVSERHPYPLPVRKLLGEFLALAALLSATLKFQGALTLQIESSGPVKLLVAQSDHEFHLRGLAQWEGEVPDNSFAAALGQGHLAITITPEKGERYQGIVTLEGGSLAACIEAYFKQSEQLSVSIHLFSDQDKVVGLFLQLMPTDFPDYQKEYWEHLNHLAYTITEQELLNLPNREILTRLFHQEEVRIFDAEAVSFRCSCTIERMESALRLSGREEVEKLLLTNKVVSITCEFCNNRHDFDKVDVARIFSDGMVGDGSPIKH